MKKTFLLMIILFLCGFSFAQNTDRYINLSIDTYEGAIYGDEDYGCKLWFDMGNQQDWLYIVKYDEMSNYDIAFITSHEADYFSQWHPQIHYIIKKYRLEFTMKTPKW